MQVLRSVASLRKARLKQSLQDWQSAARWQVEWKGICRRMVARMQHRHLMTCMVTWQEGALKARHMRWCGSSPDNTTLDAYCNMEVPKFWCDAMALDKVTPVMISHASPCSAAGTGMSQLKSMTHCVVQGC